LWGGLWALSEENRAYGPEWGRWGRIEVFRFFLRGYPADDPPPVGEWAERKENVMEKRNVKLFENLDVATREWVLELAVNSARLADLIKPLKEHGIEVSLSTLTRFVREHREAALLKDGKAMTGTLEELAQRGQGEAFRKGTLEAVRQRLFEQALSVNTIEGAQKLYGELLKEEAQMKELALEERKVLVQEEQVRLQRLRLRVELRRGAGRKKGAVTEVVDVEGTRIADGKVRGSDGNGAGAPLLEMVERVEEILNRAGTPEEKILEARAILGSERKRLGEG
jgi:hypothetical protein